MRKKEYKKLYDQPFFKKTHTHTHTRIVPPLYTPVQTSYHHKRTHNIIILCTMKFTTRFSYPLNPLYKEKKMSYVRTYMTLYKYTNTHTYFETNEIPFGSVLY